MDFLDATHLTTHLTTLLAAGTAPATPAGDNAPWWFGLLQMAPLILGIIFIFYIFNAPQRRKQKEMQKMMASLDKGDRITTIGGILGTVVAVGDDTVTVKVDESSNTKIKFQKSALASVEPKNASASTTAPAASS